MLFQAMPCSCSFTQSATLLTTLPLPMHSKLVFSHACNVDNVHHHRCHYRRTHTYSNYISDMQFYPMSSGVIVIADKCLMALQSRSPIVLLCRRSNVSNCKCTQPQAIYRGTFSILFKIVCRWTKENVSV